MKGEGGSQKSEVRNQNDTQYGIRNAWFPRQSVAVYGSARINASRSSISGASMAKPML